MPAPCRRPNLDLDTITRTGACRPEGFYFEAPSPELTVRLRRPPGLEPMCQPGIGGLGLVMTNGRPGQSSDPILPRHRLVVPPGGTLRFSQEYSAIQTTIQCTGEHEEQPGPVGDHTVRIYTGIVGARGTNLEWVSTPLRVLQSSGR